MSKRKREIINESSDFEGETRETNTRGRKSKIKRRNITSKAMGNCFSSEKSEVDSNEAKPTFDIVQQSSEPPRKEVVNVSKLYCQSPSRFVEWNHIDYIVELNKVERKVAETVVYLLDNDNTIPFIARYRRNQTCGLDADTLRMIKENYDKIKVIKSKAEAVKKSIEKIGKLTPDLEKTIKSVKTLNELEQICLMYKNTSKKTLAEKARDAGLGPIAEGIIQGNRVSHFKTLIKSNKKDFQNESQIRKGVIAIIADLICKSQHTFDKINELRKRLAVKIETTKIENKKNSTRSSNRNNNDDQEKYNLYYDRTFSERSIEAFQILAINRAEAEKVLSVQIIIPNYFESKLKTNILQLYESAMNASLFHRGLITSAFDHGYKNSIKPSMQRRIRNEMTGKAYNAALETFAMNLKYLLLVQPVRGKVILGIDPGYTHGCKLAVISQQGDVLETGIIYPHCKSGNSRNEAVRVLINLIKKHDCSVIALGNGAACRETELLLSDIIKSKMLGKQHVEYSIVDECGASIYSCSKEAKSEFPNMDYNLISAVSIARRLQDPLAEFVKIDPKCLGVGMYQHDLPPKELKSKLNEIITEVVSFVGVDINTASHRLLRHVAGLSESKAKNLIQWRQEHGPFTNRTQLQKVKGIGAKTFEQCAGFIRIMPESALSRSTFKSNNRFLKTDRLNYLDQTWIHPESYPIANTFIQLSGVDLEDLGSREFICAIKMLANQGYETLAKTLQTDSAVIETIVNGLTIPKGEDIRSGTNSPLFRRSLRTIDDLIVGSLLTGVVRNVTAFGVFVDIGVGKCGLIPHKSIQYQLLTVGQRVEVKVNKIERERMHINLNLVKMY